MFRNFSKIRAPVFSFFWLFLSSALLSDSSHLCSSSFHIVGSLCVFSLFYFCWHFDKVSHSHFNSALLTVCDIPLRTALWSMTMEPPQRVVSSVSPLAPVVLVTCISVAGNGMSLLCAPTGEGNTKTRLKQVGGNIGATFLVQLFDSEFESEEGHFFPYPISQKRNDIRSFVLN